MVGYILRRLAWGVLTVFVLTVVVFVMVRLIPGDPIAALLGRQFDIETATKLRQLYNLDAPIHEQYTSWIGSMLTGDLGNSLINGQPISSELRSRIPRTLLLMFGGVAVAVLIAVPAGIVSALFRNRLPDMVLTSISTALMAVPSFLLGIVLIVLFAVQLSWLPASGFVQFGSDPVESARALILPWLTVGLAISAYIARVLRSSLLDSLSAEHVRTARAWGVKERSVIGRHAMRNASIPVVTVVGLEVAYLMGGAIVIEAVFSYPGVGRLLVASILGRDYPIIQAGILFFAVAFVIVNLLTDLLYAVLDPRIRR